MANMSRDGRGMRTAAAIARQKGLASLDSSSELSKEPTTEELIQFFQSQYPGDPRGAWMSAIGKRRSGLHDLPAQQLADAEHYLWGLHNARKGLRKAMLGLGGPLVHSAKKNIQGLLTDLPEGSSAGTGEQFMWGQRGVLEGLRDQLIRTPMEAYARIRGLLE